MSGLSATHAEWFESRKLSVDVASEMGVHSRGPMFAFPYMIKGALLYVKTRDAIDKRNTRCVPSGVEQTVLWNEDCLQDDPTPTDTLIITEGEPDAIAVKQIGYQFVVSLPSGAASTPSGCRSKAIKCLCTTDEGGEPVLKANVAKFKRVLVMTDGDHDGLLMRASIIELIGEEYCWLPTYSEGQKDANDVVLAHGEEALREIVERAKPAKDDGFIDFITAEKTISPLKVLPCGIPFLAPHFKPVRPSFVVIGGQAGHGKSSIAQAILYHMLEANEDLRASVFHAEGDKTIPVQRAKRFWRSQRCRNAPAITDVMKGDRDRWVSERLAFISPPQDQPATFKWLLWAMERQALHRKRNVFLIDPWNQIMHPDMGRKNKTDYIGECIYEMKRLAERHNLILIVAAHTTKATDPRQPPGRYDIADSAHWLNAADHMFLVWKPDEGENVSRLEVAKSKDHERMGKPGTVWVGLPRDDFGLLQKPDPTRVVAAKKPDDETPDEKPSEPKKQSVASTAGGIADPFFN